LVFIELDGGNLSLRKDAIREACDIGDWEIARQLIDTGLETHPEEASLLALSGFAHLQAQSYVAAEKVLSAALAKGLDAAELHYNLAFAVFMQKRFADALEHLRVASPALPLALLLRARCLHQLNRRAEAIADCRAHLAVVEDADASGLLALLLYESDAHDHVEARTHLSIALRQNPNQLEALLALASMQSDSAEYAAARISFGRLVQAHPQCGRGWLGLALIELTHMQIEAAKRNAELAATHLPEHIGTWHVLAWIEIMRGDAAAAEIAFDRALTIDRNFGETHGGLAVTAAWQGREDDARMSIKRALRLDPQTMSAQYAEMLLLQRHGKRAEARAVLDGFLIRRAAGSDVQYRELIIAHMKYLGLGSDRHSDTVVLH